MPTNLAEVQLWRTQLETFAATTMQAHILDAGLINVVVIRPLAKTNLGYVCLVRDQNLAAPFDEFCLKFSSAALVGHAQANPAEDPYREAGFLRTGEAHPGMLRVHLAHTTAEGVFLLTQFHSGGTFIDFLVDRVVSKTFWTEEEARTWFRELVEVVHYLHNGPGVVHLDLKPDNALIAAWRKLKLSDFGSSKVLTPAPPQAPAPAPGPGPGPGPGPESKQGSAPQTRTASTGDATALFADRAAVVEAFIDDVTLGRAPDPLALLVVGASSMAAVLAEAVNEHHDETKAACAAGNPAVASAAAALAALAVAAAPAAAPGIAAAAAAPAPRPTALRQLEQAQSLEIAREVSAHAAMHGSEDVPMLPQQNSPGTLLYQDPAIRRNAAGFDGRKADIFSLGCILHILVGFRRPFDTTQETVRLADGSTGLTQFGLLRHNGVRDMVRHNRRKYEDDALVRLATAMDLLEKTLVYDPAKRISTSEILAHPWFTPPTVAAADGAAGGAGAPVAAPASSAAAAAAAAPAGPATVTVTGTGTPGTGAGAGPSVPLGPDAMRLLAQVQARLAAAHMDADEPPQ